MRFLIMLSFLLLISCGATLQEKANELHVMAIACNKREIVPVIEDGIVKVENGKVVTARPKDSCKKEWDDWNESEEAIIKRMERNRLRDGPKCPERMIAVCDRWCMIDKPANRVYSCISENMWRRMF